MKKRIATLILSLAVAISSFSTFTGTEVVNAAEKDGKTIETAFETSFDQEYSVKWGDVNGIVFNKIVLTEKGTIKVDCTEAHNNTIGYIRNTVRFYDEAGNCFNAIREEDAIEGTIVYNSLNAGTYYISIAPQYGSYVESKTSTYKFSFTAAENTEAENNGTQATANRIITDKEYYGFLGSGFSYTGDKKDDCDYYKVKLIKGRQYRLITDARDNNQGTLMRIIDTVDGRDASVVNNAVYTAPYTGDYFLKFDNYSNKQYKYTFKLQSTSFKWSSNRRACTVYYYGEDGSVTNSYKCKVVPENYISRGGAYYNGHVKFYATSPVSEFDKAVSDTMTLYKISKGKISATAYTYDGKVKHPTVKITDDQGHVIDSSYYKVTYSKGCTAVGTYKVYVKFDQKYYNYTDTLTYTFKINPAAVSFKKLTAATKAFTATWAKQSGASGYQVQYSTKKNFSSGNKAVTVAAKYTSKKVSGLKKGTTYYVRVRSYKKIGNTTYYGKWSVVKKVKVK